VDVRPGPNEGTSLAQIAPAPLPSGVYRRRLVAARLLALPIAASLVVACASSPTQLTCPTKAQSVTYHASGSCSGGATSGEVTLETQPGLCAITVKGGAALNLPSQGQFWGDAMQAGYDLTKGSWYLFIDEGDTEDGFVEVTCDTSLDASGEVNLACSGSICPPDDCGGSSTCSYLDCAEHLTPAS
jgi:hypothetical protein